MRVVLLHNTPLWVCAKAIYKELPEQHKYLFKDYIDEL